MRILVAYASRQGTTQGIAERIVGTLRGAGCEAHARLVNAAGDLGQYEAFVIGSGCHLGHWRPEATEFVHRHQVLLSEHPTWLFSSGPLGTDLARDQGRRNAALGDPGEPVEIVEFCETIRPRDHRLFAGAEAPAGDRRQIDGWADEIAADLTRMPAGAVAAE